MQPIADDPVKPPLQIVIDSREQRPLALPNSIVKGLSTGDYSALGYENLIAVERKSIEDLLGCIGQSRDRFQRELERLAAFPYPAIVVECTMSDILNGTHYSHVHP